MPGGLGNLLARWVSHSFNFFFLPKNPREVKLLNPSATPCKPALLRKTHWGGYSSWWWPEG